MREDELHDLLINQVGSVQTPPDLLSSVQSRARSIRRRRVATRVGSVAGLFVLIISVGYLGLGGLSGIGTRVVADSPPATGSELFDGDPVAIELDLLGERPEQYPVRSEPLPPVDCADPDAGCDVEFVFLCGDGRWQVCFGSNDATTIEMIDVPDIGYGLLQSPDGRHILSSDGDVFRVHDNQGNPIVEVDSPLDVRWFGPDQLLVPRQDDLQFDIVALDGEVLSTHEYPPGLPAGPEIYAGPHDLALSPDRSEMVATFVPTNGEDQFDVGLDIWRYRFNTKTWTRYELGDWFVTTLRSSSLGYGPDQNTILTFGLSPLIDRQDPDRSGPLIYDVLAISLDSGEVRTLASVSTYLNLSAVPSPGGTLIALRGVESIQILDTGTGELSNSVLVGSSSRYPGLSWAPSGDRLAADVQSVDQAIAVLHIDDNMVLSDPFIVPNIGFDDAINPHWFGSDT